MDSGSKVRVLDEDYKPFLHSGDIQRGVPTTLFRDLGWSGVPPTPTLDLDVRIWMGALSTIPLTSSGLSCPLAVRRRLPRRSGSRFHNLSPPNGTFRNTQPRRCPPIRFALSEVVRRLNTYFKQINAKSSLSDAAWGDLASLPNLE